MGRYLKRISLSLIAAFTFMISLTPATAEEFVGTDIESRVIVGLSTDSAGVQALLPEGWASVPFPNGPLKGANLLVSFVDGLLITDAEDKPLAPLTRRAVILLGLAKESEGDAFRIFVMRSYTTAPEHDPYGVNVAAEIARTNSQTGPANSEGEVADSWNMTAGEGELRMSLDYTTGPRSWSPGEANSFSAATPDFYRIYRYDSLTDLVMSTAIGKPMTGDFSLTSSVPELASILDGNEQVIAILDIPIRIRKTYLP